MSTKKYKSNLFYIVGLTALIVACGGGGGATSQNASGSNGVSLPVVSVITGTAAVGAPIVDGIATIKCASNTTLPTTKTSTVGGLSMTLTDQTFPCVLQITGGTINGVANTTPYHSIASSAGNVNATPLTDLLIANLAGTATPSAWFANLTTVQLTTLTQSKINTALTNLQAALGSTLPTSIHPITTAFEPKAGVQMDDVLSAYANALSSNGSNHANLLTNAGASTGAAFTSPAGFATAFSTGFTKTLTGGGTPAAISFAPATVALGGTVTITGTNMLPVTQVVFTGPTTGTNSSPTVLSNIRTVGILGTQTATGISVTLPSYLVTGTYTVSLVHPGGETSASGTLSVTTDGNLKVIVTAPASFAATPGGRKVYLSWQAVAGAKGYNIYRSTSAGVVIHWSSKVASCLACVSLSSPTISDGTATSFTDGKSPTPAYYDPGSLSPQTKYYYVIRAVNIDGDESASSTEVSATTGN